MTTNQPDRPRPTPTDNRVGLPLYAAIDLGSNSFHLLLVRCNQDRFEEVARAKEMVQLARNMDSDGNLDPRACQRALACLSRFRQLLDAYQQVTALAVATKVLRMAKDPQAFVSQAETQLGLPIRIISAEEEARLVYSGIASGLSDDQENRLVIDIGGASTELVAGQGTAMQHWVSLDLGCVTSANLFFSPEPAHSPQQRMQMALDHARQQLQQPLAAQPEFLHNPSWTACYGASGTLKVVLGMLNDGRPRPCITRQDIESLINIYTGAGQLPAFIDDSLRHDVLPAGLAIILALFDTLNLSQIDVANASIKEGLLQQALANRSN